MRINQGFLGWGVFLILVGAIPLAVNAGVIPAERVDDWWSYWPLILVGIGIGIVLSRTAFNWLGGLVVAATFGLMVGSLAATEPLGAVRRSGERPDGPQLRRPERDRRPGRGLDARRLG